MQIKFSEKTQMFQAGIFAVLNERKEELLNKGMKIYNLSVGTPDFKPAPHVMEALTKASSDPENYKYALKDKRELLDLSLIHI